MLARILSYQVNRALLHYCHTWGNNFQNTPLVLEKSNKTPGHSDENNGEVASLPRDQRCWYPTISACLSIASCRIASERPTLLAQERTTTYRMTFESHRFRETNAVGTTAPRRRSATAESHRFRETNAVGTCTSERHLLNVSTSHRFRETNAVGTRRICS